MTRFFKDKVETCRECRFEILIVKIGVGEGDLGDAFPDPLFEAPFSTLLFKEPLSTPPFKQPLDSERSELMRSESGARAGLGPS